MIKRHFKVRKIEIEPEPAPKVPQIINTSSQEEVQLQGSIKDDTEQPPQEQNAPVKEQANTMAKELSPSGPQNSNE